MKKTLIILFACIISNFTFSQTSIPDTNFEQALINLGLDVGTPNGTVPTANIDTLTSLNINSQSISDLTGIQDFISLTDLNCRYNNLTNLNLTNNTALSYLHCSNNQLTNLDISQNTALTILYCVVNQLTSLDITNNTALNKIQCGSNPLTSLDVTNNTALTLLYCGVSPLTSLDVSQNTTLTSLSVGESQITSLDVTNNTALIELRCMINKLTILDVSQNTALTHLDCSFNILNCLNAKNGNNNNFTYFESRNNNLNCITVDNVTYSNTNWTLIDSQTSFSTSCSNDCSTVGINENNLSKLLVYPNPTTGFINISLEETKSNVNLSLTNALGQVILTQNYKSTNHINFRLEAPEGVYFLQIESNDEVIIKKIIKE